DAVYVWCDTKCQTPKYKAPHVARGTWHRTSHPAPSTKHASVRFNERCRQQRQQQLVVARQRISDADAFGWASDDVGLRAIKAHEVDVDRREIGERPALVARERHGLEEHFRQHD